MHLGHTQVHLYRSHIDTCIQVTDRYMYIGQTQVHIYRSHLGTCIQVKHTCTLVTHRYMYISHTQVHVYRSHIDTWIQVTHKYMYIGHRQVHVYKSNLGTHIQVTHRYMYIGQTHISTCIYIHYTVYNTVAAYQDQMVQVNYPIHLCITLLSYLSILLYALYLVEVVFSLYKPDLLHCLQ